jgi:hypothetical protein
MTPDNFGYFDAIKNIKYKNLIERYEWFTTDNYFRIRVIFPQYIRIIVF